MRILYSWLCDYIDEKVSAIDIASNLKKLGFGIESITEIFPKCENVYTAKVLEVKKHPNADRLKLCKVTTGSHIYDVVCGADNVREGIIVPFAIPGSVVGDKKIEKAKIRGILSNGMICSSEELQLEEKSEGIMILDENLEIGRDIKEIFSKDWVFDIEITPNLAYCLSHWGLARELSIFFGYRLIDFDVYDISSFKNEIDFNVSIETDGCLRYTGIVVKDIRNKTTPHFIYDRLKKIGANPKGNFLIDLSNYVMFDIGQPTHFFDLSKIDLIVVRQALNGEKIKTLDGSDLELDSEIMVIADSKKPLAVAGVIGGIDSSINNDTSDIFIEIANFDMSFIRMASKKLNIKTDSSYRFERGVDYNLVDKTAGRLMHLIKRFDPNSKVLCIKDVKSKDYKAKTISVDTNKIERILGIDVDKNKLYTLLSKMDLSFDGKLFNVPSYRYDIESIWDLSEEYLRYVGYDKIVSKTSMKCSQSKDDPYLVLKEDISKKLFKFSFNECYTYDLVSERDITVCGFDVKKSVKLLNPISKDFEYLRPTGIISMLKVLRHNLNRDVKSVKIYEFGNVFLKKDEKVDEKQKLFILAWGFENEHEWWNEENKKIDFFVFKTAVESIFDYDILWRNEVSLKAFAYMGGIYYGSKNVGFAGLIKNSVLRDFDIKCNDVFYAEIDLEPLIEVYSSDFYVMVKKPRKVSPYQYSVRDLSIVVDKKYSFFDIYSSIKDNDIWDVSLIDVYEDEKIGDGKRSLTFRFIFFSYEKTFTDEELNKKIVKIFEEMKTRFGASLR